uniref:Uncharacterized protein n=1 Tax=Quercus lobata TaxID=97700 RepID=A0A7N2R7B6_QUELO
MARREAGETSSGISEDLELDQARIKSVVHAKENVKPPRPKTKDTKGEKYKLVMTNEFVNGSAEKISGLYKKVGEKITELRDCYEEEVNNDFKDDRPSHDESGDKKKLSFQKVVTCQYQWIDGNKDPIQLLDLLRTRLLGKHQQIMPKQQTRQSYRNVQELRAAGIHVERSKKEDSCLRDISFTELCCLGYLWLPQLTVDDSTRPKSLNLIAYEMCLDFKNDFGITSYIFFLDSLIDEANDVKMLRKAGILYNCLGSDEEVAQVFNEIGTNSVPNNEIYGNIRFQIQKHYKNKFMTMLAQFYHDHFSSPWTFMAFVGALSALVLTFIQTKYAVNSPPGPCDDVYKKFT